MHPCVNIASVPVDPGTSSCYLHNNFIQCSGPLHLRLFLTEKAPLLLFLWFWRLLHKLYSVFNERLRSQSVGLVY